MADIYRLEKLRTGGGNIFDSRFDIYTYMCNECGHEFRHAHSKYSLKELPLERDEFCPTCINFTRQGLVV